MSALSRDQNSWKSTRSSVLQESRILRAAKASDHPALVRIEKVSIGRANMPAWRRERAAAQNLLTDKPLVVVFVEVGFESGIRRVVGSRPFPHVANHLLATVSAFAFRECADRSHAPESVLEKIAAVLVRRLVAPRKRLLRIRHQRTARRLFPFSFSRQPLAGPLGER